MKLNKRMRQAEELVARRTNRISGGVDALLATVVDRASGNTVSASTSSCSNDESQGRGIVASTSLYPDLVHAANERRKIMKV